MAVRDDWAPGEVLTSGDLNDTFAAKQNASSTGLVLIDSQSFTSASDVIFGSKFTSSYTNYFISLMFVPSTSQTVTMQLRSGTSNIANNYGFRELAVTTAVSASGSTGQTAMRLGFSGEMFTSYDITLKRPAVAAITSILSINHYAKTGSVLEYIQEAGFHDVATAYDGCRIYWSTGTATGIARLYGFKD